jgi:very-short-patch-repair endonuclease
MKDRMRVYHLTELKSRRRDLRQRSTKAEKMLWERLRNNKVGVKFRRQFSISGYVVDFYCPEKRLIVELLGNVHKSENAKKYDKYRKRYLESFQMTILEFWNDEVEKNVGEVLDRIRGYLTPDPSPKLWRGE